MQTENGFTNKPNLLAAREFLNDAALAYAAAEKLQAAAFFVDDRETRQRVDVKVAVAEETLVAAARAVVAAERELAVCNLGFALGVLDVGMRVTGASGDVSIYASSDAEVDRIYGELLACVVDAYDREHCRPPEVREHSGSTWRSARVKYGAVDVGISGPHRKVAS